MEYYFILLYIMAALYILAGINHFVNPVMYLKITPNWVPYPDKVNLVVGGIEIMLGVLLCLAEYRQLAAWGIILLLIAVFPANIRHYIISRKKRKGIWLTTLRLPVQLLLIYWAFLYT